MRKFIGYVVNLVIVVYVFGSIRTCAVAEIHNTFAASLVSYDYCDEWNWGEGYQYGKERNEPVVDLSYVSISPQVVSEIEKNPEQWRKMWLRVHITPGADPQGIATPFFHQSMSVRNVSLNCPNLQIYWKEYMEQSADAYRIRYQDDWKIYESSYTTTFDYFDDKRTQYEMYWDETIEQNESEWILEAIVFVGNVNQEQLDVKISEMVITFDITLISTNGEVIKENVTATAIDVCRNIRMKAGAVSCKNATFWIETNGSLEYFISSQHDDLVGADKEEVKAKVLKEPEKYQIIAICFDLQKEMPWGMCNIEFRIPDGCEDVWLLTSDTDKPSDKDLWFDGVYRLNAIFLLMKTAGKSETELKPILKSLSLKMKFSTEFAGQNWWTGYASYGYPGMRFSVDADMSQLLTSDEWWELHSNEGDG